MSDLDDLERKYGLAQTKPAGDDFADLEARYAAPRGPGPLRDNPTFSTKPPETPAPGVPRLPPVESLPKTPDALGASGAAAMGVGQGLTGGFLDEINAAMATWGGPDSEPTTPRLPGDVSGMETYRKVRGETRDIDKEAAAAHPVAHGVGQLAGAVASPISKVTRAGAVGRIVGAGIQGGIFGAGESEADATKGEIAPLLKDAGKSAAFNGVVAGAGEAVKAGVTKVGNAVKGNLERRILNEIAEGETKTTNTARMKLDKAGAAVVKEVVHGPDGNAVRAAYLTDSAKEGVERLKPIMGRVGATLGEQYDKFEKAGKGQVNLVDYLQRLRDAAEKANGKGDAMLKRGINAFADEVREMAADSGQVLTLQQLRGLTSQTQRAAASAMGALNLHAPAVLKNQISAIVSREMGGTLLKQSAGDPALRAAAKVIVETNPRYYALKTISDTLVQRATKESSGRSLLVRGAEKMSQPAALLGVGGGVAGAFSGDDTEGRLKNAAIGMGVAGAGKALPALARGIERVRTTAGINAARGTGIPGAATKLASDFAGAIGRIGGRAFVDKKKREEDRP